MGSNNNPIGWTANQVFSTSGQPFDTKTGAIDFAGTATTTLHDLTATFSADAAKFAGRVNPIVNTLTGVARVTMAYHTQGSVGATYEAGRIASETTGGLAGAWSMTVTGALSGSEVPVLGNILGGAIGFGIGYFGGSIGGGWLYDKIVGLDLFSSNSSNSVPSYNGTGLVSTNYGSAHIPSTVAASHGTGNLVKVGYEWNALDQIAYENRTSVTSAGQGRYGYVNGVYIDKVAAAQAANSINAAQSVGTPPPPGGYNFPDPLGGHGPSFSPSRPGPGPAPVPMNLSTSPMSTPHAGGFTVTSHTGISSRGPYALEGPGATSPAASTSPNPGTCTSPGITSPSLPGASSSSSSSGMGLGIGSNGITPSLPVVLDLNGNGVEISLSTKAAFDYDGDGFREPTAWVAPSDGFLVIDLNADGTRGAGDGKIDHARELVLSQWGPAGSTDLQAVEENNAGLPMAA